MKGAIEVLIFILSAFPQAATTPLYLVEAHILLNVLPPTVSIAPFHL